MPGSRRRCGGTAHSRGCGLDVPGQGCPRGNPSRYARACSITVLQPADQSEKRVPGVPPAQPLSAQLFALAAHQGDREAWYSLAEMTRNGMLADPWPVDVEALRLTYYFPRRSQGWACKRTLGSGYGGCTTLHASASLRHRCGCCIGRPMIAALLIRARPLSRVQFNLAGLYQVGGAGVDQDLGRARELYEAAAAQGLAVARQNLGAWTLCAWWRLVHQTDPGPDQPHAAPTHPPRIDQP